MDLSILQAIIPDVAGFFHIQPTTLLFYLIVLSTAANLAGRLIPDDVDGWLGRVRDISKILGAYIPNRVSAGVTVNDVTKSVIGGPVTAAAREVIQAGADLPDSLIPSVMHDVEEEAAKIVPAFPGLVGIIPKEEADVER